MLMAVSAQAQVAKQSFRKFASSVQEATVKPVQIKDNQKKRTSQELKTAKQAGAKQALLKQKTVKQDLKDRKRGSAKHRSFAPSRVEAAEATPVNVPYEADFMTSGDAVDEDFIIINNNDDESDSEPCTWKWSSGNGLYYVYNEDGVTGADDYVVLPVILEGGKTYDVTVNAAKWNYTEEFEVVAGTECSADALTTTVIPKTEPLDDPADYSGSFTPTADGVYYIAIHATSAADQYILSVYRFSIDIAPDMAAPAEASDLAVEQVPNELKNVITFAAPTQTIGGETLTDNISIDIVRNGETVKTLTDVSPGSGQTYTDEVPAEGIYRYMIVASNAAGQGRKSDIVSVRVIMPQDVPFAISFKEEEAFDRFMVVDNNGDGTTWFYSSYDEAADYLSDFDNEGDDYLISQPLRLKAGKQYDVTVHIAGNNYDMERFEVVAGTEATAEGLNMSVIEPTEVTSNKLNEYSGSFTAETDGLYYVAVHAISDARTYHLYVVDLNVEQGAEPTAPAAPALSVTVGAEGALAATVVVTAPDKSVEGNALSSISKLELYRDDLLIDEWTEVSPGAVLTSSDEGMLQPSFYTYRAMAYNEYGKGEKSEKTTVYIGLDQPLAPETILAVDHAESIDLSWSEVKSVGMNGGYVNPAEVTYNIWDVDVSEYYVFFNDLIASLKGETSHSFEYAVDEGEQMYKYFAVRPVNEATEDEDQADWTAAGVFAGKPYTDVVEGFADESLHYFWESDAMIAISNYSSDDDGVALALLADTPGQKAFISGKLDLKDAANPMLIFDALNASNISTLYVMGSVDQKTWNLLQVVSLSEEDYQNYQIPLNSLKNHERYAQIAIVANYTNVATEEDYGDMFFIDNIRIGDFLDNNLSVSASAPSATLIAGNSETIDVVVENIGLQAASNYTVKVMAGEKELLNETVADELASFAKKHFLAELSTSVFDEAGDVLVTISVDYTADQDTDNNNLSAFITIEESTAAAPGNLTAEDKGASGINLEWTVPEVTAEFVTEDFESGAGEFTQIDGNGDGFGWDYMYDDELKSNSGNGGMQSYSWLPNGVGAVQVDNWLVTPLAILDGTFSCWAAAQDGEWTDEHFAVYVSTTGNESVDDFTQVSDVFDVTGWSQEFTVDLSSYAGQEGYIAIRHFNSYDNFALVVDDISFTKAPSLPAKYNVYVDQQLIATVEGEVTTYTMAAGQLAEGEHSFAVTAVYASGNESRPVTATLTITSDIRLIVADGQPFDIYSVDGRLLRRQVTTTAGLKGIYVVNGHTVMIK